MADDRDLLTKTLELVLANVAAIDAGFQGVLCVENYGGDGLSVCATNRDYLRRHILPKRPGYRLGRSRVRQADVSALV